MSRVVDIRLLASDQRVALVVECGEIVAVHLERSRLTPEELEELYSRVRDGVPEDTEDDDERV